MAYTSLNDLRTPSAIPGVDPETLAALGLDPGSAPDISSAPPSAPVLPAPSLPESSLGDKIAPGASIPKSQMRDALAAGGITGQQSYEAGMPKLTATPGSADYFRERQEQLDYKQAHPWGSIISPHPGIMGKIGHVASQIGNIAGDIFAPAATALIPGSDLNNRLQTIDNLSGITQGTENAQREAATAATEEATKEAPEKLKIEQEKAAAAMLPKEGKTTDEQALHDLMTGDSGRPRVNPQTQKPYTYLEAYTAVKQAAQDTKAPAGNDFEQFYRQKVKEGLADTAANRQTAYSQWVKNEPQYQAAQAQREATNADRNEKKSERQGQAVYGYDPASGHTKMMREQDALDSGLMYDKVTAKQVGEDRQLLNRLNDVQLKIGRYEKAMQGGLDVQDKTFIASLLQNDKFKAGLFGIEIPVDKFNELADALHITNLSDRGKKALVAYYNAREAMTGYNRVLTGTGRSNEKTLELQLQTLPQPATADQGFSKEAFNQFKENLVTARAGFPENIPGVKTSQDIDAQAAGGVEVKVPGRDKPIRFPDQKSADAFKKEAHIQ